MLVRRYCLNKKIEGKHFFFEERSEKSGRFVWKKYCVQLNTIFFYFFFHYYYEYTHVQTTQQTVTLHTCIYLRNNWYVYIYFNDVIKHFETYFFFSLQFSQLVLTQIKQIVTYRLSQRKDINTERKISIQNFPISYFKRQLIGES